MNETQDNVLRWLAHGSTGTSSETMAHFLGFGRIPASNSHPHDPDDFDRCLRLLVAAPGLRPLLPRMADVSPYWAALVQRWDEIERGFIEEVGLGWCKAKSAPKTYKLMNSILDPITDSDPDVVRIGKRITVRFRS